VPHRKSGYTRALPGKNADINGTGCTPFHTQVVNGPPPIRATFERTFRQHLLTSKRPGIIGCDTGLAKISASVIMVPHPLSLSEPMITPPYHQSYAAPGRQLDPHTAHEIPKADTRHHHPPPRQIPPHRPPLNQGGSQFLSLS